MTGWIVLGVVVLLILLLLSVSLVIVVDVGSDGVVVSLRFGFLRFQLFPMKERPSKPTKKKKKHHKPASAKKPAGQKPKAKKKLPSVDELLHYIELGKEILGAVGKAMRRILKGIRITEFELDAMIAGPDAAEAALSYGKISGLIWYALGVVDQFFTLSIRSVTIRCDFETESSCYRGHAAVKLRIATMVAAALGIVFRVLAILLRERRNSDKG